MKLFVYDHCPFCIRSRMIFGLKSMPVEVSVIMEGDAETPTKMIGKKMFPILQKEDGTYMAESLDIVKYVDSIGVPVLTGNENEAIEAWLKDVSSPALKLMIPRFTKAQFPELETQEARESFRLREEKAFGDLDVLMSATPELLAEVNLKLANLARLLEGREQLSLSDITLWPILRSLTIVDGLKFPEPVLAYILRLKKLSNVPLLFNQKM